MSSNKTPIVSIIVPCYNQAQYLPETLDSVLVQTYYNWECIVVNDGSTDNSLSIANEYACRDQRIKVVSQENSGPSAARNHGVQESHGKFILFLDGDDIIAPNYLARGLEYLESHPTCVLYYSKIQYIGKRCGIFDICYTSYKDLLAGNSIVCTCLIHRKDFDRVGGFDENMKGYEDWEFFIRLLYKNEMVFQDSEVLFYYRIHDTQNSVNAQAKKRAEELSTYLFNKHYAKYQEYFGYPQWVYAQYNRMGHEINGLLNSNAYKLGHVLITPLQWLKSIIKR